MKFDDGTPFPPHWWCKHVTCASQREAYHQLGRYYAGARRGYRCFGCEALRASGWIDLGREDAGNCPACECAGLDRARMLREHPQYMAALDALPPDGSVAGPSDFCWSCQRLIAGGHNPRLLMLLDAK